MSKMLAFHPREPHAPDAVGNAWDYCKRLGESGVAARIGTGAFVVLHAIATHADEQGRCFPGHKRIAECSGMSVPMVKRHIKTLEICQALKVERHTDAKTKKADVNVYILLPLDGVTALPRQPRNGKRRPAPDDPGNVRTPPLSNVSTLPPQEPTLPPPSNVDYPKGTQVSTQERSTQEKCPERGADAPAHALDTAAATQESAMQATLVVTQGTLPLTDLPPIAASPPPSTHVLTPYQQLVEAVRVHLGVAKITKPQWNQWAKAGKELVQEYGLEDALACTAWYFSDGWWHKHAKDFHLSKILRDIEVWIRDGRPTQRASSEVRGSSNRNGHKGQRLQPMTYEETQAAPPVVQCRCCGNQPGQDHESYCVSGLRGPVLVGQECVK